MPTNLELLRHDDFTGGLNLRADQFQLAQNESPKMLNVEIDPRGGVFSRGGMRRISTSSIVGGGILTEAADTLQLESGDLFSVETISGWAPKRLNHFETTANYLMLSTGYDSGVNGDVFSSTGGDFTSLSIPVTNTEGAQFAEWGSTLHITPGLGAQGRTWNATTVTTINSTGDTTGGIYTAFGTASNHIPQCKHLLTHAGKLFAANVRIFNGTAGAYTDYPNRIYWSDENAPLRWTATNFIEINDHGNSITGLASFNGTLLVFKQSAVYAIYGYNVDTFQVVELTKRVGALSSTCIATTERGVYFFSWPEGLFVYTGSNMIDLFEPIRPIILTSKVNSAATAQISVSYINRRVWLSVPYSDAGGDTKPTSVFVYDPSLGSTQNVGESFGVNESFSSRGSWTQFQTSDGYGIACGASFVTTGGQILNVAAHPVIDCVFECDVYSQQTDNFDGTESNFPSYYRTRWIDAGNYSQKKMFRRPDFILKQASTSRDLYVKIYHNYEEAVGSEKRTFYLNIPASGSGAIWGSPPTGNMVWGVNSWGAPTQGAFIDTGSNLGLAKSVQIEINGPTGKSWGFDSFMIKYNPRRIRG